MGKLIAAFMFVAIILLGFILPKAYNDNFLDKYKQGIINMAVSALRCDHLLFLVCIELQRNYLAYCLFYPDDWRCFIYRDCGIPKIKTTDKIDFFCVIECADAVSFHCRLCNCYCFGSCCVSWR